MCLLSHLSSWLPECPISWCDRSSPPFILPASGLSPFTLPPSIPHFHQSPCSPVLSFALLPCSLPASLTLLFISNPGVKDFQGDVGGRRGCRRENVLGAKVLHVGTSGISSKATRSLRCSFHLIGLCCKSCNNLIVCRSAHLGRPGPRGAQRLTILRQSTVLELHPCQLAVGLLIAGCRVQCNWQWGEHLHCTEPSSGPCDIS